MLNRVIRRRSLVLVLVCCFAVDGWGLSLSEKVSKDELGKMLAAREDWRPFPKAKERAGWGEVSESIGERFVKLAEGYLETEIPMLPATLYLEYQRIGNRSNYQDVWYERRKMLHCLVIGECIEGKGRFLDKIADVVWAICEESSWTWPAHISRQKAGVGLPDVN